MISVDDLPSNLAEPPYLVTLVFRLMKKTVSPDGKERSREINLIENIGRGTSATRGKVTAPKDA